MPDVIPMHYGTFPILAGTPDQLRSELAERGVSAEVHELQPGRRRCRSAASVLRGGR